MVLGIGGQEEEEEEEEVVVVVVEVIDTVVGTGQGDRLEAAEVAGVEVVEVGVGPQGVGAEAEAVGEADHLVVQVEVVGVDHREGHPEAVGEGLQVVAEVAEVGAVPLVVAVEGVEAVGADLHQEGIPVAGEALKVVEVEEAGPVDQVAAGEALPEEVVVVVGAEDPLVQEGHGQVLPEV